MAANSAARRLYTIALNAFPRRHRAAYAPEMIEAFERELLARRERGGLSAMIFIFAACANAIAAGIGERRRHRRVLHTNVLFSRLDFLLAWRMMLRYPGLSIVAVFGMTVGIALASGAFAIVTALTDATLPLPEGDRIVSLVSVDVVTGHHESRMLHDVAAWSGMTSVEDVSLTRTVQRNLILDGRPPDEVTVAEISASAFRVTRVPALRGRHLLPEDERPGAPDAIVIGHDEWVKRFDADPNIVGRTLRLGSTTYTIVGVMPEGYSFPLFHGYWIPWRLDANAYAPRTGPSVNVFGRLANGSTLEQAHAEIAALRASTPSTPSTLAPGTLGTSGTLGTLISRVVPYTHAFTDMDDPQNALALYFMELAVILLLVVVCVNVAILVYARTATRLGEIAVRGALGASRRRIVAQLFVEAMMLSGVSAVAGIFLAAVALRQLNGSMLIVAGRVLPFWMSLGLSTDDVIYVTTLAVISASIIGVVPALKATSARVHMRLQTLSPGSGSRMVMGRVWATLIVAQVALTVMVLPASMFHAWTALRFRTGDPGFAAAEFLTTQMVLDRATAAPTSDGDREFTQRFATLHRELDRRLREAATVSEVTFSMAGIGEDRAVVLEIEGQPVPIDPVDYGIAAGTKRGHLVWFNRIATNFFDAFDVPIIMGRGLRPSDTGVEASAVLVNRTMVETIFGGASPLSARVRYVGRSSEARERDVVLDRWYEIVGVVPDFPTTRSLDPRPVSRLYHAADVRRCPTC